MNFLQFLLALLRRLFGRSTAEVDPETAADSVAGPEEEIMGETPASMMVEEGPMEIQPGERSEEVDVEIVPIEDQIVAPTHPRVLAVIFDPKVPGQGNQPLTEVMGWNDPVTLLHNLADDLRQVSYGYADYNLVDQVRADFFPPKKDGFQYDADEFITHIRTRTGFHQPDAVDYHAILHQFSLIEKVRSGQIDEVWLIAPPYSGLYESTMAGTGAFFCNAPVLTGTQDCPRRFVIMGFNFERGLGEMLEAYGHRAESILQQLYRNRSGEVNLWERYTRVERTHPGGAEVGTIHYAPNSLRDYEWGRHAPVLCGAERWMRFPNLEGQPTMMDCSEWGGGDNRAHKFWWLSHLPHVGGQTGGIANNWWKYLVDVNKVK